MNVCIHPEREAGVTPENRDELVKEAISLMLKLNADQLKEALCVALGT